MILTNDKGFEMGDFRSIHDLTEWLDTKGVSATFRGHRTESLSPESKWAGVVYDDARELLQSGWSIESEKLNAMLNVADMKAKPMPAQKFGYGVVGFAPVVPLVLAGVPQNMLTKVKALGRDKVITVNKSISYNCGASSEEIEKESVKALAIVRRLEKVGYAVNLNVVWGVSSRNGGNGTRYLWKVRVKAANERMNISKVAFPLVNPAFLRRIMFSVLEKWDGTPDSFTCGYGYPIPDSMAEGMLGKKEILLPAFIDRKLSEIRDPAELANALNIQ